MRQLLAARFPPESAAARVNNKNKHCAIWHESTHLQPAEVARHHARQAKRLAARRRPVVHVEAGGRGRKPMARHHHHAGHDARALRWPKRNLRVAEGWWRLAQLGAWSKGAREVEAQRVHELERGVDLAQLRRGDAHQSAEEAIVVFELEGGGGGRQLCRNVHAPLHGALLAHEVHPGKRGVARVHARSARQIAQHAAPRALAVDGAVALQPAAVSNERVAQEDGFRERGVAQRRQQAACGGGIKSASAGGACIRRNCWCQIREGALGERPGEGHFTIALGWWSVDFQTLMCCTIYI